MIQLSSRHSNFGLGKPDPAKQSNPDADQTFICCKIEADFCLKGLDFDPGNEFSDLPEQFAFLAQRSYNVHVCPEITGTYLER